MSVYTAECNGSCMSRGCNCDLGHVPLPMGDVVQTLAAHGPCPRVDCQEMTVRNGAEIKAACTHGDRCPRKRPVPNDLTIASYIELPDGSSGEAFATMSATADRLATLPEGSHVDRSGHADTDQPLMRTVYVVMEETARGDRYVLAAYSQQAAARKECAARQARRGCSSVYYIHQLPLNEDIA